MSGAVAINTVLADEDHCVRQHVERDGEAAALRAHHRFVMLEFVVVLFKNGHGQLPPGRIAYFYDSTLLESRHIINSTGVTRIRRAYLAHKTIGWRCPPRPVHRRAYTRTYLRRGVSSSPQCACSAREGIAIEELHACGGFTLMATRHIIVAKENAHRARHSRSRSLGILA